MHDRVSLLGNTQISAIVSTFRESFVVKRLHVCRSEEIFLILVAHIFT